MVRITTQLALLLVTLASVYAFAMSGPQDEIDNVGHEPDPVVDANTALANGDKRLLCFASRATIVPGVELAQKQAYIDKCGLRFIEGFGDVIRSEEQLENMKKAEAYAKHYNAVIIMQCRIKPAGN